MSHTVTMPQLGETVTEGTVLRWVKQPGDTVAEDDVLLEISTDKVDTEVPSPFAGTLLEILVPEGATVDVGTALAVIGDAGSNASEQEAAIEIPPHPTAPPPVPEPEQVAPVPVETAPAGQPTLSPVVRRLAAEHGVDLATVVGTGRDGRITRRDVEAAAAAEPIPAAVTIEPAAAAPEPVAAPSGAAATLSPVVRRLAAEHGVDLATVVGTGRDGRITRRDVEAAAAAEPTPAAVTIEPAASTNGNGRKVGLGRGIDDLLEEPGVPPAEIVAPAPAAPPAATVEPIDRMRTRIATNLVRAKQTAAHVWTSMEVDYESVERVRQRHRPAFKEREGMSLTYMPFIARATVDALGAYPVVNSSFDLETATRTFHGQVDLGIGVDLDQKGLVVMTMRGADGLRLRGIAREVKRLADKARGGGIEPDDLAGSTFTITNPGPYGSYMSAPIINLPNVAILSTDSIKKRPVVVQDVDGNDALAIHHIGFLGLTWDHRAFDGSTAVLFLKRIKENLETWDWEQELA